MNPHAPGTGFACAADKVRIAPALAAAVLLAALLPESVASRIEWQRDAIVAGEAWRLATAPFAHHGFAHGAANAIALLAAGVLAERAAGWRRVAVALGAATIVSGTGLLAFAPAMESCRGASCLAWALAGLALWAGPARQVPAARWVFLGLAAAKIASEAAGAPGIALPEGIAVAWAGHGLGLACGIAAARPARAALAA